MTNFPVLFASLWAMAAKLSMILEQAVLFISYSVARASAMADLVIGLTPVAFIVFMGAIISLKAGQISSSECMSAS